MVCYSEYLCSAGGVFWNLSTSLLARSSVNDDGNNQNLISFGIDKKKHFSDLIKISIDSQVKLMQGFLF